MKFNLQYAAVCAMGAVVGCQSLPSVGPDYREPEFKVPATMTLPDAGAPTTNLTATGEWKAAAGKDDARLEISNDRLAKWWTALDDKVVTDLIENCSTNNLGYKMALERLEQANWTLLGSYAAYVPKFSAGGAWNRNWYTQKTTVGARTQYNVHQVALDGNWEIDVFGGSRRLTEAAKAAVEAANWSVADSWLALTTSIGEQYVNLRTTQERLAVAHENLKLQTETYDILKSRFDSGIGDELAVNQCAYIVEQTRAKIPQLKAQEEALKNAIAILVGAVPGALEETLRPVDRRNWLMAPQKVSELPLGMMRARPDVKVAERNLAAQTAQIGAAKAQWFPKFYITGSVGWQAKDASGSGVVRGTRLFSRDSFFAVIGPSVSWPIFQGGAIYANVKATEARMRELALAYELALDNAYAEVRNNYSAYTQEYHRYQSLCGAVKAAADAVTISQDLYKNGLKDFNNVLDAQRSRLQLEEEMVLSRGQITLDLIDLYKSLGGGLAVTE